jgi:hypothetical protein
MSGTLLRKEHEGGAREVKQFIFLGEALDTMAVRRWHKVWGWGFLPERSRMLTV